MVTSWKRSTSTPPIDGNRRKQHCRKYADKLAGKSSKDLIDGLVLAKIANFQLVDDLQDIDNLEDSVPEALRALLTAHGLRPTEKTASSIEAERLRAEIASKPPRPARTPTSVNAGRLIARIRELGGAYDAAMRHEASIPDDTPASEQAIAATDSRLAELEALRDEIIAGRNSYSPRRDDDDPYMLDRAGEVAVFSELMTAFCPGFWTDVHQDAVKPVLAVIEKGLRWSSEYYLDQAKNLERLSGRRQCLRTSLAVVSCVLARLKAD